MSPAIANHLLQSTIFAIAAAVLTPFLRNNHARTRYWIWLTASLKFLIPFSLFIELGHHLSWTKATAIAQQPTVAIAIDTISQPFAPSSASIPVIVAATTPSILPDLLLVIWIVGSAAVLIYWLIRWYRVAALLRSPGAKLEPGVFGIFRPVLYLPAGIADHLDGAQLKAIVAHEHCHIRNRDNLTAALHSLVEAIFWFHPLTWWIGARLVEERERACDEEVVRLGSDPEVYAESILKICKLYIESPLTCVPGISGADLKKRIATIMTNPLLARLSATKKAMLATAAAVALAAPIAIGILSAPARAQPTSNTARFEVADVHPSAHTANPAVSGGVLRIDRYEIHHATMLDLIKRAWLIDADNVVGGPSWLDSDRFDIVAKAPAGTSQETLQIMLQSLLKERFRLAISNDTRPVQAYVLEVGKGGPKLKQNDGTGTPGIQTKAERGENGLPRYTTLTANHVSLEALARSLHVVASGYFSSPVVDQTGLQGFWDFEVKWSPRGLLTTLGPDGISLFDAVDKQLGLKLELKTAPMPVIVVDRVHEKPTDNIPNVTSQLPIAPTTFEVADIKPSESGATRGQPRFQPGGRIDGHGIALKDIIMFAWDLNSDDELVGSPKWLDTTLYDVVAKAPATLAQTGSADLDALQPMTRQLLMDRFKLKVHNENRPIQVYALVAGKPKMTKADPSNRSACKSTPRAPGSSLILSKNYTCTNVTMTQFADLLQSIAPGYMKHPGIDLTGLTGSYDFILNFSNPLQTMNPASDPNGALTLAEAIDRQLGLKLELQKHPMPVLVIDHVEEKPSGN